MPDTGAGMRRTVGQGGESIPFEYCNRREYDLELALEAERGLYDTILELFSGEDETLLVRRNSLFILDLRFYIVDSVRRLDFEGDGFTRQSLDKNLH